MHAARLRQNILAGNRVALLRHGGRPAALRHMRFRHFGQFRLHQQHHIRADFGKAATHHTKPAGHFRNPIARHMPGDIGFDQAKFLRQFARHRQALIAQ